MDFLAARKALLHRPKGAHWPIVLAGLVITLLLALVHLLQVDFCTFLDGRLYDTRVRAALFAPPPRPRPVPCSSTSTSAAWPGSASGPGRVTASPGCSSASTMVVRRA